MWRNARQERHQRRHPVGLMARQVHQLVTMTHDRDGSQQQSREGQSQRGDDQRWCICFRETDKYRRCGNRQDGSDQSNPHLSSPKSRFARFGRGGTLCRRGVAFQTSAHSTVSQLLLCRDRLSLEIPLNTKTPTMKSGPLDPILFYWVLRKRRRILREILVTIRVVDRLVGIRNGQIPGSSLTCSG